MAPIRMLFVDDEPTLRLTFPIILQAHNFEVRSAATVADALREIHTSPFDVLVADLNVGEPGDGFTIVSAMRRTQPDCVNFILTGYPAFEHALQAIRSQVDDFLTKPCDAETLVAAIEEKLHSPRQQRRIPARRLSSFLEDNLDHLIAKAVQLMKAHRKLGTLSLSDQERISNLPQLLRSDARTLESQTAAPLPIEILRLAAEHGRARRAQGYSPAMMVDDLRVTEQVIYDLVQQNLLQLDLSYLISDLARLNDNLESKLQASLDAFLEP